jgi:wyosine [tRNA(Phe)-imidazoG37] synthetase (radical SAM superfamily)
MTNDKPYIFGPVPSRRLGLSLGVDLVPAKTCSYNCLYCQVGETTRKTSTARPFAPLGEVLEELEQTLERTTPDTITLSGSGEPTLHSQIDELITSIKAMTDVKVALLTNGSLFWRDDVRRRVLGADIILPTLTSAYEKTFRAIHRPHSRLRLSMVIEGLKALRKEYRGLLFLEVVLLAGFNDTQKEIEGLKDVIGIIRPDRVQLNTVVRPPADSRAVPLDSKCLEEIKDFLGEKVEIIVDSPMRHERGQGGPFDIQILEMAKRRPLRDVDVANVLNMDLEEVQRIIKGLLIKGNLRRQEHLGKVYYVIEGKDRVGVT